MTISTRVDWVFANRAPDEFVAALPEFHPLVARTLYARGCCDAASARAFFGVANGAADGDAACGDPLSLQDLPQAVDRIRRAIAAGEHIAIYGDYDCDGVTACALLTHTLAALGACVEAYIPDRFEEGYGLNSGALDKLKAAGVTLVITVDCGARAMAEARHAREIGLDLVITDHHELENDELPDACAVINPKRADCHYPFKQLAGVGVAYRLAQCLLSDVGRAVSLPEVTRPPGLTQSLLDLVAIGTVADVVPLIGENRLLVRDGLALINKSPRLGVRLLSMVARARPGSITAQTIGYVLGPRLNAAGRIETARDAYDLLTASDETLARDAAWRLNERNEQRQKVTAEITRHAEQATGGTSLPLLFAVSQDYNAGVIGLAAARLVERFYKPAVVVVTKDGEARGSCRSVAGFNITMALDECSDLLSKHGGHAAAAGFTMPALALDQLRERLTAIAQREQPAGGWTRAIQIDAEVDLRGVSAEAYNQLQQLEPHGMGNPRPVFAARQVVVHNIRRVGKGQVDAQTGKPEPSPHLSLRLRDSRGATWDAIGWRMGERASELRPNQKIDVAFHLDINEWNGERNLQLTIVDLR